MKLTAQIMKAADGWLDLHVIELPALEAHARKVEEIPGVIKGAAAELTGRPENEFEVELTL